MAKAYITCPVSHTARRLALLPEIEAVVREHRIEPFVFEIGGEAEEIFERDWRELSASSLLIAEVSETSHGVGIEIGMSYCLGLKRILVHEKGTHVTKLAQGMPQTTIIEYNDVGDLRAKLSSALANHREDSPRKPAIHQP